MMTNKNHSQPDRVLGIAPSTRGLGFAVMEGEALVDWGIKTANNSKNERSLSNVANLIEHYRPSVIVLENCKVKGSRRAPRIQALHVDIIARAKHDKVMIKLLSRKRMMDRFFAEGQGTKQTLAELLANRFQDDLGSRVPKKRKAWMGEDSRMDIFYAVALAEHCVQSRRQ